MAKRKRKELVVFNIGYQGHTLESFVAVLKENRVTLLVDVRESPRSRVPGFHATTLKRGLNEAGIQYTSAGQQLGGRTCSRAKWRRGCKRVVELAKEHRVCIMCMERDVEQCHRSKLAQILERLGCKSQAL